MLLKHYYHYYMYTLIYLHILKYVLGVSRPKYFFLEGYQRLDYFNIEHKVNSLPSGHTQAAFTIAILFLIYVNKYTFYVLTLASLMAISRIFMSMHFPSDLIAGAYLGSIIPVFLYNCFYRKEIEKIKNKYDVFLTDIVKLLYWRFYI